MPHAWLPPSLMRQPFSSACLNAASISLSGCTLRNISPPINGHHGQVVKRQPNLAVLVVTQAQTTVCSTHRTRSPARDSSPRVRGTLVDPVGGDTPGRFIPARAGNTSGHRRGAGPAPVHPRVCGERPPAARQSPPASGSSPRVRGTPLAALAQPGPHRFIPACAGNAESLATWRGGVPGSSPRVRGTQHRSRALVGDGRFIPACAGNAPRPFSGLPLPAVHPRVCGERNRTPRLARNSDGSSPRVRGTRLSLPERATCCRFIPAWARQTGGNEYAGAWGAVHPRVCGERDGAQRCIAVDRGSSPRVRGTRLSPRQCRHRSRFIPACAGNADWHPEPRRGAPVHPRVCGERSPDRVTDTAASGSSPRVRGTREFSRNLALMRRFIPACAGNAATGVRWCPVMSVHPRVCGERFANVTERQNSCGSSPRVRGTPCAPTSDPWNRRFIPACAGNAYRVGR